MIHVKKGVTLKFLRPETLQALLVVDAVFTAFGLEATLTEMFRDPRKGAPSFHPDGWAFDLRANDLSTPVRNQILAGLKNNLEREWDVLVHGIGANIHFHLEYQPKPQDMPLPR